ncbi:cysteine proteinase, partial [Jaminaea rosea]
PAWSQPRSWTGIANKDATSFTTASYVPSTPGATTAPASEASVASSSATSPIKPAQATVAPRPSPWASKHRPSLEAILSDSHKRFAAPLTTPRGLINTGNFCFANAILQVLVFCAPFYNLFSTVGAELSADFANTTPLMESVVQFLREFHLANGGNGSSSRSHHETGAPNGFTPTAAHSEPFVPEFVYEAMRLNKRFDLMRRGHQEDAEEFLGFFLDTLHEELLAAIRKSNARLASTKASSSKQVRGQNGTAPSGGTADGSVDGEGEAGDAEEESREVARPMSPSEEGWLEVGQKGKTAFTRTASTAGESSPITRIFGGKLRSVLRTPGAKDSVTLEPYQPLQLDIQPSSVQTVEDALLNLTVPETIPGVFSPARGGPVDATKQVFIEHLPPVLVLHLKRFFYDEAAGGVQKNCKEVGYSDVLKVGGEMVSPVKRAEGAVTYRLFGVVYHHGRYATGGHYTVDVLRQDGSSWVHFDDTIFHTVAPEHVGRRAGQNLSSFVGHDGLAYLLFYQR